MTCDLVDDRHGAVFSDDRTYRYKLWRTWDVDLPTVSFLMLNPSTADETDDDPTIRRCIGYANRWGYGRLVVANLFALTATDPNELEDHPDPVGPENDDHLRAVCGNGWLVIAAWGTHGTLYDRDREVMALLENRLDEGPYALGTTQNGHPWHPLRKPSDASPQPYSGGETR